MTKTNQPILVTGSPRSGSTWVGEMLSWPLEVKYLSEPFNPQYGLKIFKSWFVYINNDNEKDYIADIAKLLKFKGDYRLTLPALKYWSNRFYPLTKRPLLKDPIAGFSSDWLAKKFNMQVVVLFRHPAAFYASLKRVNWHFDPAKLLKQNNLMADHLEPLRDLIAKANKSYAEEVATAWLCIYSVLDKYLAKNSQWIMKRHEDLSLNPLGEFRDLYDKLSLKFSKRVEKKIIKYSSGKSSEPTKVMDLKRNSSAVVKQWFNHVDQEELNTIKNITGDLALKYYPEKEWLKK